MGINGIVHFKNDSFRAPFFLLVAYITQFPSDY